MREGPNVGDPVVARRGEEWVSGTLLESNRPGDWRIKGPKGQTHRLHRGEWRLFPAPVIDARLTPTRVPVIDADAVGDHLFRMHGRPAEDVAGKDPAELAAWHQTLHNVAAQSGHTLNHVHGMTPAEYELLQGALDG